MIEADDYLSILTPIAITAAMITATNVTPEDPNPAWAAVAYAIGDRVYKASTHRVYEAAKVMTSGAPKDPELPANQFDAAGLVTYWIDAGPTNRFAMFDGLVNSKTEHADSITLTLKVGYFNGFSLLGIEADSIDAVVRDAPGGNIIYEYHGPLEGSAPADYYEYFFEPFKPQTRFSATGIDPYADMTLELTLTATGGTARLGMLAIGDMRPIGVPLSGASVEPVDYSYVSTDAFGNTVVRKRNNATGLTISAKMDIADANSALDTIKEILGTPVVVVGSQVTMYEALTVFGLVSARLVYEDFGEPTINITVKGLI
jgi:hypothetical protein